MPDDPDAAVIHDLAVRELLNLAKLYGPHGFVNILNSGNTAYAGSDGPPAAFIAALELLETATVDPTLLMGGQTVASAEARTISDLQSLAFLGVRESFCSRVRQAARGGRNVSTLTRLDRRRRSEKDAIQPSHLPKDPGAMPREDVLLALALPVLRAIEALDVSRQVLHASLTERLGLWLRMQQAYDWWQTEQAMAEVIAVIPTLRAPAA